MSQPYDGAPDTSAKKDRGMNKLTRKAVEMRNAIDMIEGAMMGLGYFVDLPEAFDGARDDLIIEPKMRLGEVRRVCKALKECTRIINSQELDVYAAPNTRPDGNSQ